MPTEPPSLAGQIVRVRQRQYLVEEVVPPPRPRDSTLLRLSCLDDDAQGQPLEVLWERELDPEVLSGEAWQAVSARGFDAPHLFSAYFHNVRWNCVTATTPRLFQAPFRAGIKIDAYQLEPLRKALLLPRVNLFIADDVGLGKTIEAGLIARELLLRKKAQDVIVACPPSVLLQWRDELESRFGLAFQVLDKDYVAAVCRARGYGVNPWFTHTRFLVSTALLVDEAYTAPLRAWLGDFRAGSLLILDEAHHAAPASGSRYAIDSKTTRAVRDLARRFEHRLFLSATPHNGHSNSFSALLEILDPQRFCRGVKVTQKLLDEVMVRRLKEDLREHVPGFPKRVVKQITIDGLPADAPELRLSALLDEYRRLREARLKGASKRTQAVAALLVSGLQQRLLSSVEAFASTLRVHRRTAERHWEQAAAGPKAGAVDLDLFADGVSADDDRSALPEEELRAEQDAQVEAATLATAGPPFARERELLEEMARVAEAARGLPDARVLRLIDWVREFQCPDLPQPDDEPGRKPPAPWTATRVILFTEYDDTKRYLFEQLSAAIAGTDRAERRIDVFHGPTRPADRKAIQRAFNADPAAHPLRILIATDAAREGHNLQAHCSHLFHCDVPWNPSRMEQRNGRIDRKLQPRDEVVFHYFVYRQRLEDRILRALVRKSETIQKELGSLARVVEDDLTRALRHGIGHDAIDELEGAIDGADLGLIRRDTVADELESTRERQQALGDQIDRLRNQIDASRKWAALREDHFRAALSSALELLGAPPLAPVPGAHTGPTRYAFPALDRRDGADPSWADTMDALRAPRGKDQTLWEWRGSSPVRPVVFEDTGDLSDESVHLHLEHPVVQRLLGRFSAQGFVLHDLSRACLAQTTDALPRVVLLGRLCLYGPKAARLHEEVVPVTARWVEPDRRKGPLVPYARDAEANTLRLLEDALAPTHRPEIQGAVRRRLEEAAPHDVRELLPHLERRGRELADGAEQLLRKRAEEEAAAMRAILQQQRASVAKTSQDYSSAQLSFDFDDEERRQLDANRRHWGTRLAAIDRELATEPARVRELYEVKARRVEPVGLVYLWPVTG